MALNPQQTQMASLIYSIARQRGLNDARARELVAASYAESGLNPAIRNKSSGATGLFQLLSGGYVNTANKLGGVANPRANTLAILPSYLSYWRSHPGAAPGEAARDVERSGMGAGFYSSPLKQLAGFRPGNVPAGAGAPTAPGATTGGVPGAVAAPPDLGQFKRAALQQLLSQVGQANPNYSGFIGAVGKLRAAQTQAQQPVGHAAGGPGTLGVEVDPKVGHVGHGAQAAVALAKQYLGTPYHWGGANPKTNFDCSGLLQWVWGRQGVNIPRVTYDQWKAGAAVGKNQLQPGDAVFFHPGPRGPEHVGMYIGNGNFIEAPRTGLNVRISKLAGRTDFMGARRYGG